MNREKDEWLSKAVKAELEAADLTRQEYDRCLAGIHEQIKERRFKMKFTKKKIAVVFAAALTVAALGTVTAVAAGKITSLVSWTSAEDQVSTIAELTENAKKRMDQVPNFPERFSNGLAFQKGSVVTVEGQDENNNPVSSYPEVMLSYGEKGSMNLSVQPHMDIFPEEKGQRQENYKGIQMGLSEDKFLFLPPDAQPSEEDLQLEKEGKLSISYGSSKEERQIFKNVRWTMDGMDYMIFTFDDIGMDDLVTMAKEVVDAQ